MSNSQEQVNFNLDEHIGTKGNLFDKMSYRLKNFRKETINPAKEKITEAVSQFPFLAKEHFENFGQWEGSNGQALLLEIKKNLPSIKSPDFAKALEQVQNSLKLSPKQVKVIFFSLLTSVSLLGSLSVNNKAFAVETGSRPIPTEQLIAKGTDSITYKGEYKNTDFGYSTGAELKVGETTKSYFDDKDKGGKEETAPEGFTYQKQADGSLKKIPDLPNWNSKYKFSTPEALGEVGSEVTEYTDKFGKHTGKYFVIEDKDGNKLLSIKKPTPDSPATPSGAKTTPGEAPKADKPKGDAKPGEAPKSGENEIHKQGETAKTFKYNGVEYKTIFTGEKNNILEYESGYSITTYLKIPLAWKAENNTLLNEKGEKVFDIENNKITNATKLADLYILNENHTYNLKEKVATPTAEVTPKPTYVNEVAKMYDNDTSSRFIDNKGTLLMFRGSPLLLSKDLYVHIYKGSVQVKTGAEFISASVIFNSNGTSKEYEIILSDKLGAYILQKKAAKPAEASKPIPSPAVTPNSAQQEKEVDLSINNIINNFNINEVFETKPAVAAGIPTKDQFIQNIKKLSDQRRESGKAAKISTKEVVGALIKAKYPNVDSNQIDEIEKILNFDKEMDKIVALWQIPKSQRSEAQQGEITLLTQKLSSALDNTTKNPTLLKVLERKTTEKPAESDLLGNLPYTLLGTLLGTGIMATLSELYRRPKNTKQEPNSVDNTKVNQEVIGLKKEVEKLKNESAASSEASKTAQGEMLELRQELAVSILGNIARDVEKRGADSPVVQELFFRVKAAGLEGDTTDHVKESIHAVIVAKVGAKKDILTLSDFRLIAKAIHDKIVEEDYNIATNVDTGISYWTKLSPEGIAEKARIHELWKKREAFLKRLKLEFVDKVVKQNKNNATLKYSKNNYQKFMSDNQFKIELIELGLENNYTFTLLDQDTDTITFKSTKRLAPIATENIQVQTPGVVIVPEIVETIDNLKVAKFVENSKDAVKNRFNKGITIEQFELELKTKFNDQFNVDELNAIMTLFRAKYVQLAKEKTTASTVLIQPENTSQSAESNASTNSKPVEQAQIPSIKPKHRDFAIIGNDGEVPVYNTGIGETPQTEATPTAENQEFINQRKTILDYLNSQSFNSYTDRPNLIKYFERISPNDFKALVDVSGDRTKFFPLVKKGYGSNLSGQTPFEKLLQAQLQKLK